MATEETIETRLISGTGVMRVPADKRDRRIYTLYAQLVRPPRSPYLNLKCNPPESFYGRVTTVRGDTVTRVFDIKFSSELWQFIPDIAGQTLITIKCAYQGILETFENLGTALPRPPFVTENLTAEHAPLQLEFDEFRIVCYATSAIQITLKATPYDKCGDDPVTPVPPPTPPTPPTPVPADTPLDIAPPYSDDDVSAKANIDESFVPPPLGEVCQAGTLRWVYDKNIGGVITPDVVGTTSCFGPVSRGFRLKPGEPNVLQTEHRGNPFLGGCSTYQWRDIRSEGSGTVIQNWRDITFS